MKRENYQRKVLYDMLAEIRGKKAYAVRMFFFRHKLNILDHNDFMEYAQAQGKTKAGSNQESDGKEKHEG